MRSFAIRVSLLALGVASSAGAQRDTVFSWSRALPAGARFSIRNLNGLIDVRPGTTDRIEVRATMRTETRAVSDVTFDVRETAADDLQICTVDRGMSLCIPGETYSSDEHPNVRFVVELPKGLRVSFQTLNGDVIVMQSGAEVAASTGNGDVVVRESLSSVTAHSGNGDVTVAAADGSVKATSGNGDVVVATYGGPVNASSGNGDVDVRMISVTPTPEQQSMSITSGNGNIRLTLPSNFEGRVDASTARGKVNSGFPARSSGTLIKVHSANGKVEIKKG